MAAGDVTWTTLGPYDVDSADIKTAMDAQSTGAATEGTSTTTFFVVPVAEGRQIMIYKMVRAGA
jgi:hypothetical protein